MVDEKKWDRIAKEIRVDPESFAFYLKKTQPIPGIDASRAFFVCKLCKFSCMSTGSCVVCHRKICEEHIGICHRGERSGIRSCVCTECAELLDESKRHELEADFRRFDEEMAREHPGQRYNHKLQDFYPTWHVIERVAKIGKSDHEWIWVPLPARPANQPYHPQLLRLTLICARCRRSITQYTTECLPWKDPVEVRRAIYRYTKRFLRTFSISVKQYFHLLEKVEIDEFSHRPKSVREAYGIGGVPFR